MHTAKSDTSDEYVHEPLNSFMSRGATQQSLNGRSLLRFGSGSQMFMLFATKSARSKSIRWQNQVKRNETKL
jgi:hypothetical protein